MISNPKYLKWKMNCFGKAYSMPGIAVKFDLKHDHNTSPGFNVSNNRSIIKVLKENISSAV